MWTNGVAWFCFACPSIFTLKRNKTKNRNEPNQSIIYYNNTKCRQQKRIDLNVKQNYSINRKNFLFSYCSNAAQQNTNRHHCYFGMSIEHTRLIFCLQHYCFDSICFYIWFPFLITVIGSLWSFYLYFWEITE